MTTKKLEQTRTTLDGNAGAVQAAEQKDDQSSKRVATAKRLRAQDRAADAFNQAHRDLVAEFNQVTGGTCAGPNGVDARKVRQWQKGHGLHADGKVGKGTVEAARKEKGESEEQSGGADVFEGEGVADDEPAMENPAFADTVLDGATGMEQRAEDNPAEALKGAGETVDQAREGAEIAGIPGAPESGAEWVKAAMAPAIIEMLREGDYLGALETLVRQFSPSEALEGLTFACEKLGLHRYLPLLEKAVPYAAGASVGLEMVLWTYDGLKAIGEAHEKGDRDSRIAMYAQAFAECFLNGEGAGDGAAAVTAEQREAVEAGRRDGAATAGKTGELAPAIGKGLLRKYGSEGNAKRALEEELLQRAGFTGVKIHS